MIQAKTKIYDYPKYWAECYGSSPFLPTSKQEMDQLGWDSCDIILVTGDAYVDHQSFGMAVIGRLLESQGFRVGIIDQPNWNSKDDFMKLGKPNLYFGITAGNMDSMINRYTADKKKLFFSDSDFFVFFIFFRLILIFRAENGESAWRSPAELAELCRECPS